MPPVSVYFGTNRVVSGDPTNPASYTAGLEKFSDPTQLTFGHAEVDNVGVAPDPPGTIQTLSNINRGWFSDSDRADLSRPGRNILVFIHGFYNSFAEAICWAASHCAFLSEQDPLREMTVIAWSWPSLDQLFNPLFPQGPYFTDQRSARLSGLHLMTFLANLEPLLASARANRNKSYLLAHSMGNLALESAVETWFADGNGDASIFDAAFLAAADCRADSFAQADLAGLSGLARLAEKIVLYYSSADQVLRASSTFLLNGVARLGQEGPRHRDDPALFPPAKYSMVDAAAFNDYPIDALSSHQYYHLSPACRDDIRSRL